MLSGTGISITTRQRAIEMGMALRIVEAKMTSESVIVQGKKCHLGALIYLLQVARVPLRYGFTLDSAGPACAEVQNDFQLVRHNFKAEAANRPIPPEWYAPANCITHLLRAHDGHGLNMYDWSRLAGTLHYLWVPLSNRYQAQDRFDREYPFHAQHCPALINALRDARLIP